MTWIFGLVEMVTFYSKERSIDGQIEDRVRVDLSIWRIDDGEIERDIESKDSLSIFRRDIDIESDRKHYISSIPVGELVKFEVQWDDSEWDQYLPDNGGWIFSSFESSVDDKKLLNNSKKYLKLTAPKYDWDFIELTDSKCKANAEQYDDLINTLKETLKEPWGVMRPETYSAMRFDEKYTRFENYNDNKHVGIFNFQPKFVDLYFNSKNDKISYRGNEEFYENYLAPACVSLNLKPSFIKERIVVPHRLRNEPVFLNSVGQCKPKYIFYREFKSWDVFSLVSEPIYVEALGTEMVFEIDIDSLDSKKAVKSVDAAINNFLNADKQLILEVEDYMWSYHYFMMERTGSVYVRNKSDLWKEFYLPRTVRVEALESGLIKRGKAFLELRACSCSWESHGLDIGYLNGKTLTKVGQTGSSLREYLYDDSDVFGIYSEFCLMEVEDSLKEQDYPNYHFD